MNDPDNAEAMVRAAEAAEDKPDPGPPMTGWDQHAELLATLIDAVRNVQHTVAAVNTPKGKPAPKSPDPYPRPKNGISAAKHRIRWRKHKALAARLLRNR